NELVHRACRGANGNRNSLGGVRNRYRDPFRLACRGGNQEADLARPPLDLAAHHLKTEQHVVPFRKWPVLRQECFDPAEEGVLGQNCLDHGSVSVALGTCPGAGASRSLNVRFSSHSPVASSKPTATAAGFPSNTSGSTEPVLSWISAIAS